MRCRDCGGSVEWQGPLSNLTHTLCLNCGAINNQEPESTSDDGGIEEDEQQQQ